MSVAILALLRASPALGFASPFLAPTAPALPRRASRGDRALRSFRRASRGDQ
jgi:hypothetical protein